MDTLLSFLENIWLLIRSGGSEALTIIIATVIGGAISLFASLLIQGRQFRRERRDKELRKMESDLQSALRIGLYISEIQRNNGFYYGIILRCIEGKKKHFGNDIEGYLISFLGRTSSPVLFPERPPNDSFYFLYEGGKVKLAAALMKLSDHQIQVAPKFQAIVSDLDMMLLNIDYDIDHGANIFKPKDSQQSKRIELLESEVRQILRILSIEKERIDSAYNEFSGYFRERFGMQYPIPAFLLRGLDDSKGDHDQFASQDSI